MTLIQVRAAASVQPVHVDLLGGFGRPEGVSADSSLLTRRRAGGRAGVSRSPPT